MIGGATTGSVPGTDDASYQARVRLFAGVLCAILTLGMAIRLTVFVGSNNLRLLIDAHFGLQLIAYFAILFFWLYMRSGTRTRRQSETAELVAISISASALALFSPYMREPLAQMLGPEALTLPHFTNLAVLYALTQMMVLRAAIIPSTATRTMLLTADTGTPMVLVSGFQQYLPGLEQVRDPWGLVGGTMIWWGFTVITCTVLSRVIFGLRQEIREARQLGQYTLEAKLGEGGMGRVYRASHAMLRRPTAVKLLLPDRVGEAGIARFEREVQLTAELTHPNTITIYDYGRTPEGIFYYVMELLDGASLEDIVAVDGAQSPGRVIHLMTQVAAALAEAHGTGFIHRDVKPPNIFLCRYGGRSDYAKVLDFGLVKDVQSKGEEAGLTHDGAITGTPMYMSPEMLSNPDSVDAASDIYALGAVGYFMLTGKPVFEGRTLVEICGHHLHSEPPPPADRLGAPVPEDLAGILLDCLSKDPGDRPESADVLITRLERCEEAGSWSETDARAWWSEHRRALRERLESGHSTTSGHTIAVDLGQRA